MQFRFGFPKALVRALRRLLCRLQTIGRLLRPVFRRAKLLIGLFVLGTSSLEKLVFRLHHFASSYNACLQRCRLEPGCGYILVRLIQPLPRCFDCRVGLSLSVRRRLATARGTASC
jgi:hypothetical protein